MKKMKKTATVLLALALVLSLCSCALSQAIGGVTGGGTDDPNLGLWRATSAEMLGMEMDISDAFGEGFTIELKSGGKCTLVVDGDKARGKWTLDDEAFSVKGGGIDAIGTLKNGVLTLENVLGTGFVLYFEKEGGSGGNAAKTDADYFVLTSITEGGETASGADLAAFGLDGFYILLHKDGKAEVMLDPLVSGTWKNGEIDLGDMGVLEYSIKGDQLTTEIDGSTLVYTRSKDAPPASAPSGGTGSGGKSGSTAIQQWWNGDWYGYWEVYGTGGAWTRMEGGVWDCYAQIDIDADGKGTIEIWDDEVELAQGKVEVSTASGSGEMGAAISIGGTFGEGPLNRADWIIDPSLYGYDNYMVIDGYYTDPEGSGAFDGFSYRIVLRPWGTLWSEIAYDEQPPDYYTWYLDHYTQPMPGGSGSAGSSGNSGGGSGTATSGRGIRGNPAPGGGVMAETEVTGPTGKTGVLTTVCPEGWYDNSNPDWEGTMSFSATFDAWDTDEAWITIAYSAEGTSLFWTGKPVSSSTWKGFYNAENDIVEMIRELDDGSGINITGGNIDYESEEFQRVMFSLQFAWD